MLVRILSSLLGCAIIIPVLIFSGTWAFPIFMALVCLISVYEMMRCVGAHKKYYLTIPLCVFGAAMPILARLSVQNDKIEIGFCALAICAVTAIYLLTVSLFSREKFNIEKASTVFLTLFYIVGGYTALVLLRDLEGIGKYVYLLTFVGAWFTDIFAYFTGRFLGRHKLIPDIYNVGTKVLITRFDDVPYEKYIALADSLRSAGIVSSMYIGSKKFGKQIDYAVKGHYSHVVIMGGSELEAGVVKVKDLNTREESTVALSELPAFFAN